MSKKTRSSQCVQKVFEELGMEYEIVETNPDLYATGISLEHVEDIGLMMHCYEDSQIYFITFIANNVAEEKAEAVIDKLAELNRDLRFFTLSLSQDNSIVATSSYVMVESLEESVFQVNALLHALMSAIDAFGPELLELV